MAALTASTPKGQKQIGGDSRFCAQPEGRAEYEDRGWGVTVTVEGVSFSYQLTEDDLHVVFERYGIVNHVEIAPGNGSVAYIFFQDSQDAEGAINDLNGKLLTGVQGRLKVLWGIHQNASVIDVNFQQPPAHPQQSNLPSPQQGQSSFGGNWMSYPGSGLHDGSDQPLVRKFTCRFEIQIENDKEFQVARRIIGQKGCNMKKIVKQTDAKLRLRGKGSGYLEGVNKSESPEPLHLCISCMTEEGYKQAVGSVKALLEQVYEEYRVYCRERGLPEPQNLGVGNFKEHHLMAGAHGVVQVGFGSSPAMPQAYPLPVGSLGNSPHDQTSVGEHQESQSSVLPAVTRDPQDTADVPPAAPGPMEVRQLIDRRNMSLLRRDFAEADRIRDTLKASGVAIHDEPAGGGLDLQQDTTIWRYLKAKTKDGK